MSPSNPPTLDGMPTEILINIYIWLPDVQSTVRLSETSTWFHDAYESEKLQILRVVLETQFSPLSELYQISAHMWSNSKPHRPLSVPPLYMPQIKILTANGMVAQRWQEYYPQVRFRDDTGGPCRRRLRTHEAERFRKALYRFWKYTLSFHSPIFLTVRPYSPLAMEKDTRLSFMRRFTTLEIIQLAELFEVFRDMISWKFCPNNSMIQEQYSFHYPEEPPLDFTIYKPAYRGEKLLIAERKSLRSKLVAESWGTWAEQMVKVDNIMKMDPAQMWHFCHELHNKHDRVQYLESFPSSFHNNPTTFRSSIDAVMAEKDLILGRTPYHNDGGGILDIDIEGYNAENVEELHGQGGYSSGSNSDSDSDEIEYV